MTSQTPEKPRRRGLLRIVLFVSLALNLLVAGAVVGHFLNDRPDRRVPRVDRMGGPLTFALTHEDRRAIGHALRREYRKDRPSREEIAADYRDVIGALRADPFDATRVQASLDRQLNAATDRIALGQRLLMERIVEMSAEDRAAFADRLEEGVQRMAEGKPPRKYDRD